MPKEPYWFDQNLFINIIKESFQLLSLRSYISSVEKMKPPSGYVHELKTLATSTSFFLQPEYPSLLEHSPNSWGVWRLQNRTSNVGDGLIVMKLYLFSLYFPAQLKFYVKPLLFGFGCRKTGSWYQTDGGIIFCLLIFFETSSLW